MHLSVQMENTSKIVAVKADYEKMQEIAKAVYDNPSLLKDFERDPAAAAYAINGFVAPKGMHIHIADDYNYFTPAEDYVMYGAVNVDFWDRVEIRAGYKTFSFVVCGQRHTISPAV